ncbi:MAG: MBL fold metallo-hydrolase [Chloroflexi bacterium]|nr:MAG: MBL fold metallo-hydrolase [Chloroflexota bacterium]
MKQIAPGLYTFTGLLAGRVYLIQDDAALTLIDTGIASAADKIVKQLRQAGHQPSDVKHILITHAHPDHIGGLPKLKATTGAQVMCSTIERPVVEGQKPIPRPAPDELAGVARFLSKRMPSGKTEPPTPVDREINDGDIVAEVMGGLHIIGTPGHAPGHISFWQPERRILFLGDVIMRFFGRMREPFRIVTVDPAQNRQSIQRIVALEPSVACFGHGTPLTEQATERLKAFATKTAR